VLAAESFFRKPPYILDEAQKRFTSAFRYAYEITELHYKRLLESLTSVSIARRDISPEYRIGIFADAWGVLDNLNRSRQLLSAFPNVKNVPKVQAFVKEMDEVRSLRNRFQHMDEDFASGSNLVSGYPVYGNLTWFQHPDEKTAVLGSMMAGPSSQRDGGTVSVARIPTNWERPIGNVCLAAFDRQVQISSLVKILRDVVKSLDESLSIELHKHAEKIAAERNLTVERVLQPAAGDVTLVLEAELSKDGKSITLRSQSNAAPPS
jgi:hypothetical protein